MDMFWNPAVKSLTRSWRLCPPRGFHWSSMVRGSFGDSHKVRRVTIVKCDTMGWYQDFLQKNFERSHDQLTENRLEVLNSTRLICRKTNIITTYGFLFVNSRDMLVYWHIRIDKGCQIISRLHSRAAPSGVELLIAQTPHPLTQVLQYQLRMWKEDSESERKVIFAQVMATRLG